MAVTCLFVSVYTRMMNVTTNGAESWVKVVQEMKWRCKKWQGAEAAFPCRLDLGWATCRLFPAVPLAHCLIHSKICHLSAFPMSPSYPAVLQATWATQGPHQVLGALPRLVSVGSLVRGQVVPAAGRGGERQRASLSDAHQPRIPSREVLCPAPRLMYSQTSQMAGAEPSLCLQGGVGGDWILAAFTMLINPLLSDFQTDERGGPGAETCCRLAVLENGFHPPSLMAIPCIWFPQVSKFQCCNPKRRKF